MAKLTTEELDMLQFGKTLHSRPAAPNAAVIDPKRLPEMEPWETELLTSTKEFVSKACPALSDEQHIPVVEKIYDHMRRTLSVVGASVIDGRKMAVNYEEH
jgi:hypothetical protein